MSKALGAGLKAHLTIVSHAPSVIVATISVKISMPNEQLCSSQKATGEHP